MPKFFVEKEQLLENENKVVIVGEDVNHIKNVLRLVKGTKIEVSIKEKEPRNFWTSIEELTDLKITCNIINEQKGKSEANISVSVVQGIPKSDKMELIIQKCTELGVDYFIPLELKRCVSKIVGKDSIKKIERWQKIAEVASKQCLRDKIPIVEPKMTLNEFCKKISDYDLVLVAYEKEEAHILKEIIEQNKYAKKIAIVIGPEGGLEKSEIETLTSTGAKVISLGNRILRTETAPIALSSILMYELGDIGGEKNE